jgi:hypothetical protein
LAESCFPKVAGRPQGAGAEAGTCRQCNRTWPVPEDQISTKVSKFQQLTSTVRLVIRLQREQKTRMDVQLQERHEEAT